jgi:hypothetical protein
MLFVSGGPQAGLVERVQALLQTRLRISRALPITAIARCSPAGQLDSLIVCSSALPAGWARVPPSSGADPSWSPSCSTHTRRRWCGSRE